MSGMYDDFAAVYDAFMDDFDYPKWADYYIEMIRRAGWNGGEVCECACGTGSLSVELLRRGVKLICSDLSESMLRVAMQKAMQSGCRTRFIRQDMRSMELPHRVSAIICACDGVNYLTSGDDVRAFFGCARDALVDGGVIAFDISSPYKFEKVLSDGFFCEDREEAAYLWQNNWDAERRLMRMDLTFFVRAERGLYRRFDECHLQRSHTIEEISLWLDESGFNDVKIYSDMNFNAPVGDEMRLHFCAVRR